jgi:hypothetical protein
MNQLALQENRDKAIEQVERQLGPMELIQQALSKGTPPEVIRELVALQQSMERFNWEREERQAKIDFDTALNECQSKIGRIAPNQNRENGIKWADYSQLDRAVRPVYIEAGFSIGFSEVESADKNRLRMCAMVSRGGISREYFADISRVPPNSKMNQTDADASAASRVKRYLLLDIFNIAIGIDAQEKQPFEGMPASKLDEWLDVLKQCATKDELQQRFNDAFKAARAFPDRNAMTKLTEAKDARKAALNG